MSVRKRVWTNKGGEVSEAWVVNYTDGQGKRRLKTFGRKKDADQFEATAAVEVAGGMHVADRDTRTVAEAGKLWLRAGSEAGLERTTLDQRRQHLELHIQPFIGAVKLNKITAPFIRDFQDKLRDSGRSPAMIRRIIVSLGSILADAQGRGLIIRNAVHELTRARSKAPAKRDKAKLVVGVDIPTTAEISKLLKASEGKPIRPLLVTAIFTGLRASELRGLRWEDIDLARGTLTVRQRADRYGAMGSPKSASGRRTVPLPSLAVNTLKEWKLACPKGPLGLAFPNGVGKVEFHHNIVARGYQALQIEAGVTVPGEDGGPRAKYPGLHALRHWFASWCINAKKDGGQELSPKAVQTQMGHGSITVTFDTYGHLFPVADERKELEEAQARVFGIVS